MLTVCLRSSGLGTLGLRRMTLEVCYHGLTPDLGVGLVGRSLLFTLEYYCGVIWTIMGW